MTQHTNDTLSGIRLWFQRAIPHPTTANFHTQLGVHFEEVHEMVETLEATDGTTAIMLKDVEDSLKILADHLKGNDGKIRIAKGAEVEFLDSLCDQIVTATGAGYMKGYSVPAAAIIVNQSNWSKFVNSFPVFDTNNKIAKGPDYFKADLSAFITPE